MSRAKSPAVDAAAEPQAEPTGRWRYRCGEQRTYVDVPVTVDHGDVIEWPACPASDGWWEPTDLPVTRRPDNAVEA